MVTILIYSAPFLRALDGNHIFIRAFNHIFCLFHLEILLFRLSMAINIEATETKNKYLVQKAVSSHFSSLCSMLSIQLIERFKLTLSGMVKQRINSEV